MLYFPPPQAGESTAKKEKTIMDNLIMQFNKLKKDIFCKEYLRFNSPQREAVFNITGPSLILAGAGSGKTTVIVGRCEYMLKYGDSYNADFTPYGLCEDDILFLTDYYNGNSDDKLRMINLLSNNPIRPWNILAITFTNKAAGEMKERLEKAVGTDALNIYAGTFHSICVRILRMEIERLGYEKKFAIYDQDDSLRVIKDCIKELEFNEKIFPPRAVLKEISNAKDEMMNAKAYEIKAGPDFQKCEYAKIFAKYESRLKNANALDFDDLICKTVELFKQNPDVLAKYQEKFQYILVDEYQDTNQSQYQLVSLLSAKTKDKNICVVGDDDQSIYKFRGATIQNILNFEKQYKNTKVIRLEQNYRSTGVILDAANAVIANNSERKGKNLWTAKDGGDKIKIVRTRDESDEASYITSIIEKNVAAGGKYSDHAVLYRMNAQSQNIERSFVRSSIPYRIFGGTKFYGRKEIKDILAYMSIIINPDDSVRLTRIINEPKRGIGLTTIQNVIEISQGLNMSVFDVLKQADTFPLLSKKSGALIKFANMITELEYELDNNILSEFLGILLEKTVYIKYLEGMGKEAKPRIENIMELKTVLTKFQDENDGGLAAYLEEVALYTDIDNYNSGEDCTVLMTLHSAKGLEFPCVFLSGMEEGIFPSIQSSMSEVELEEERRLAYVGITRAKQNLHLTQASQRMIFGTTRYSKTSRFIQEIPANLTVDVNTKVSDITKRINIESDKPLFFTNETKAPVKKSAPLLMDFKLGQKVEHPVFGIGEVLKIDKIANDKMLEISFDKAGIKKIMAKFGKLSQG